MRNYYYESTLHKQIRDKRENRKERIKKDIDRYGREILDSDEMKEAYDQTHHLWSTVAEHSLRVTLSSVMITYALRKLKINVSVPAVVIGSLCHDLGILGRDEKFASGREMSNEHPVESVKVAKELVEELPEGTEDIIERHMWPAGNSKAPNSIEGIIVSLADKYSAVKDLVKGSDVNNTGVRNVAREKKSELRKKGLGLKEDLQEKKEELKADIQEKKEELKADLQEKKEAFKADIQEKKEAFKADFPENKEELSKDIQGEDTGIQNEEKDKGE